MNDQTDQSEFYDEQDTQESTATESRIDLAEPFAWQASEGVTVKRTSGWYAAFGLVVIGLLLLAIFVFKSLTFAILVPVMAVAVLLLSSKQPRIINYGISPKGIYIGDKLYDFSEFRGFGVVQDPSFLSIAMLPVKRFSPGLTIYFEESDGERIVDFLGARLPIEEVKLDTLEKLIRLIRL